MNWKFSECFILLMMLICVLHGSSVVGQQTTDMTNEADTQELDFKKMVRAVPMDAKFIDDDFYIWGGSMVRDAEGKCHLLYARWPRELGHNAWVTHSEVARRLR
jgi:hypothetical protein